MPRDRASASPFNAPEEAFALLVEDPHPVTMRRTDVAGIPMRPITPPELRSRMLHPSTSYAVRDAVLDALIRRAHADGGAWVVTLAGMLLPGLRRASVSLVRACPERADDIEAEMLAGLVAAIGAACPGRSRPAARLVWAARRSAEHLIREELSEQDRTRLLAHSAAPPRPFGHPDLVLARAVAEGVVCAEDAELIGSTRLGELNLRDAAEMSGVSYAAIKARRARAERALVTWLREGIVAKAPRIPGSSGAGRPRGGRRLDRRPRLRSDRITDKEVRDGPLGRSRAPVRPARPAKPPAERKE
jgi:DNA-directed RNA polymerase specialized sigma24 family protein